MAPPTPPTADPTGNTPLIRLIGSVEVTVDGRVHRFSAPKPACVLAALAVRPGEPVGIPELMDRVWGAEPPESAIGVLYSYVARLRATIRRTDRLRIRRAGSRGYVLDAAPNDVDVHLMRDLASRAAEHARRGDLATALRSWRRAQDLATAEALVGIGGRWAEEYRTRFRRERLRLLADRYGAELALGHHRTILGELAELVAHEPMAEPLVEHLMLAQYRCGRAAEALESFDAIRIRLRDRLGADPSPSLSDLHRRILRQDPGLDPPLPSTAAPAPRGSERRVPAQLPAATTGFVGRDDEAAAIYRAATDRRIVVIDGMAGVGKTALALHTAHRMTAEYPDGQLFVNLCGYAENVRPVTPDNALVLLLRALDAEVPDDPAERPAAFRTALAGRRVLLVLDNAIDAAQVEPLLPGSPDCLTIVTSRRRMVDLLDARPVSLDVLPPRQAAEVFAAEAGIDADPGVVDEIAAACGRLPLALRIAASRLRNRPTWTPEVLLNRLDTGGMALRELDAAGRGVAAAFTLSYRELDPAARRMFRLLSVFPGTDFDRDVAAILADIDPDASDAILEQLVDIHLLQPGDAGRYRLHDLLRHYGSNAITDDAERDAAWRRLADGYLHRAWAAIAFITPQSTNWPRRLPIAPNGGDIDSLAAAENWLRDEFGTLEHLVRGAVATNRDDHVIDLSIPLQAYLLRHGGSTVRSELAEIGIEAARRLGDMAAEARLTNYLGAFYNDLSNQDAARTHFRRAIGIWRQVGDVSGMVASMHNLASIPQNTGDEKTSVTLYSEVLDIAHDAGLTFQEIHIRISLAGCLYETGRFDEARDQLDRAETLIDPTVHGRQLVRLHYQRGVLAALLNDLDTAERFHRSVIDYGRTNGLPDMLSPGLNGLTDVLLRRADYAAALTAAQDQLGLFERWPMPKREAHALIHLGRAQAGIGETADAIESLRAAMAITERIQARRYRADAAAALADLLADDDRPEALRLLTEAARFYTDHGYPNAADVRRRLATLTAES